MDVAATPAREKPLLRGVSHEIAFYVALLATALLTARAHGVAALAAASIYGASLCALFGTSALYHRRTWSPKARELMRRFDHSAIFILIAGTFTPMCLLLPDGGPLALVLVWSVAVLGVLRAIFWRDAPKPVVAALSVVFGCGAIPTLGHVGAATGPSGVVLVALGGVFYITGAVIYAMKRPDPSPRVLGYHEIFHALVIAGSCCHYAAIAQMVQALSVT